MDDRIACPICGADQPATAHYCRQCGSTISGDATPSSGFENLALLEARVDSLQAELIEVTSRVRVLETTAVTRPVAATAPAPRQVATYPAKPSFPPTVKPAPVAQPAAVKRPTSPEPRAMPVPVVATTAQAPSAATPVPKVKPPRDWEQFLSGQGMAIVGGLAIVIGAVFFLSLAFSRGWIGPEARVVIGIASATVLIGAGWRQFTRKLPVIAHVLTAAGMGVMMLSLFASTRLYDLVPIELALLGSLVTATAAALIAIRFNTQVVAAYGIVSALAAPPILGAEANGTTIAFMATALVGTTLVALYRTWTWLPHLAFVLSAPQLADWVAFDAPAMAGMVALTGFWLLHALSAGGEEFRRPTEKLRISSALLLGSNSLTVIGLAYALLEDDRVEKLGPFLFLLAGLHLALGIWFLATKTDRHPFGMLATAGGIATLLLAISEQFNGVIVAAAWTLVALAVAWFAAKLRNPFGAAAAGVAGALIFAHLWIFEYPLAKLDEVAERTPPFFHAEGATLAAVLAALTFAGWVARRRDIRIAVLNAGALLVFTALPHELSGERLVLGWITLLTIGAVIGSRNALLGDGTGWFSAFEGNRGGWTAWVPAVVATALAFGHTWVHEYPLIDLFTAPAPDRAFLRTDAGLAGLLLLALAFAGWISRHLTYRVAHLVAGTALVITVLPHELSGMALFAAWCALIVLGAAIARFAGFLGREPVVDDLWADPVAMLRRGGTAAAWFAGTVLALGNLTAFALPFEEIADGVWVRPDRPFLNQPALAALMAAGASMAAALVLPRIQLRRSATIVTVATLAYLMPFQVSPAATVVAWSVLAILVSMLTLWDEKGTTLYRAGAVILLGAGAIWTIVGIAPPERLVVDAQRMTDHLPLWSPATAALGALALALLIVARRERVPLIQRNATILTGAIVVYLLSVAVVDHFQQQVGGETGLESLQKQAQVGLSILWAILGGATFAIGALTERKPVRLFALALLGLATAKVFILDLASLNASYRVPSFIALGVLLLASSYIYQRHRARKLSRHDTDDKGGANEPPPIAGATTGAPA